MELALTSYIFKAGFGWTNGVALWVASNYGDVLVAPDCPSLLAATSTSGTSSSPTDSASPTSSQKSHATSSWSTLPGSLMLLVLTLFAFLVI